MTPLKGGAFGDTLELARAELGAIRPRMIDAIIPVVKDAFHAITASLLDKG